MDTIAEMFALGLARHQAGDLGHAGDCYRCVLARDPGHAQACHFLGVIDHQTGDHARAIEWMRRSIALNPGNVLFHSNLAAVYRALGQLAQAVTCYRNIVSLQPEVAEWHFALANSLLQAGQLVEAEAYFRHTVRLNPEHADAHNNLGVALYEQRRLSEAVASYHQAIHARADFAEALNNLGNALKELGWLDEAVASYEQALQVRPDFSDTYGNLGNVLSIQGELPKALASYRRALELRPDLAWVRSNYLLCLNYNPDLGAAELFEAHCRWGGSHEHETPRPASHRNNAPMPQRRLRIGYLANNFGATAFSCFVQPVLAAHDPARVEVFCYQLEPMSGASGFIAWRSLRAMTPSQVAELVRADGIDVLVDLLGHTRGNWLAVFPYRSAPVQVTWLGYPNTTGLKSIAYRLTDSVADPPGEPIHHTEELVRLPVVFCCYGPSANAPPVARLPALGNGHLTFGSHHNLAKLNPAVLELWGRVLRAVPSARLLIFRDTLRGSVRDRLLAQFAEYGVSSDRIEIRIATEANLAHLAVYHEIDVALDAFPWTGHTTTCDALWMGVPVLTLRGTRHAGRMAASVLSAVGLTEMVTQSPDEFVARATQLATDTAALAELRAGLRERMRGSPLCDATRFTRGLEDTFWALWQRCS